VTHLYRYVHICFVCEERVEGGGLASLEDDSHRHPGHPASIWGVEPLPSGPDSPCPPSAAWFNPRCKELENAGFAKKFEDTNPSFASDNVYSYTLLLSSVDHVVAQALATPGELVRERFEGFMSDDQVKTQTETVSLLCCHHCGEAFTGTTEAPEYLPTPYVRWCNECHLSGDAAPPTTQNPWYGHFIRDLRIRSLSEGWFPRAVGAGWGGRDAERVLQIPRRVKP
jgi:hypothetical protein